MQEQASSPSRLRVPSELIYALGILFMALGVSCVSRSVFGYSMIVAPAYILHAKVGVISFGTMEYLWQGVQLIVMCLIVRRFRVGYLFSFVTAVIYGLVLDGCLFLTALIPAAHLAARIGLFAVGTLFISLAVALSVRTYLAPAVYELFVKELSARYGWRFGRVKWIYDFVNLAVSISLSLILFGGGVFTDFSFSSLGGAIINGFVLEGIGIGTVIAAVVNGPCIGFVGRLLDRFVLPVPLFPRAAAFLSGEIKTTRQTGGLHKG